MNRILLIALCFFLHQATLNGQKKTNQDRLIATYEKAIDKYEVPGMAVAIVKNDSLVFSEGFGILSIHNQAPVDSKTLFGIASLTKTFTAALFANAVADVKIDYDATIKSFLSNFELYDEYVTDRITFRDILSHRSGLGNFSGDLIWYGSRYSTDQILSKVRFLEPKYGFRTRFGYSNIFYLLTGKVLEDIYRNSFDQVLDSILLKPLRMANTYMSYSLAMQQRNLAKPHIDYEGQVVPVPYISWDNMLPAGGLFSNVDDLSNYIRMLLKNGQFEEKIVINSQQLQEIWKPHTYSSLSWLDTHFPARVNFKMYGMGWSMMDFEGHKVLMHSGGLDGMVSQLVIVPDMHAGAVFLVNKASPLPAVLMYDWLAQLVSDSTNYVDGALEIIKRYSDQKNDPIAQDETLELMSNSAEIYCGTYSDRLVGDATVFIKNNALRIKWKESTVFEGVLTQKDVNVYELFWPQMKSLGKGELVFKINGDGSVAGFQIVLPNPDLHFDELHFMKL